MKQSLVEIRKKTSFRFGIAESKRNRRTSQSNSWKLRHEIKISSFNFYFHENII